MLIISFLSQRCATASVLGAALGRDLISVKPVIIIVLKGKKIIVYLPYILSDTFCSDLRVALHLSAPLISPLTYLQ